MGRSRERKRRCMNILHVISRLDPSDGGPPMALSRLAAAQAELGARVTLAALEPVGARTAMLAAYRDGQPWLDEVVGAYAKGGVHGSIVTKVDEAAGVANVLDTLIRHRLPLNYVTNGQRVPEDLHLPNRAWLLHRAVRPLAADSAHGLSNDEFPLLAAGAARGVAHA